MTNDRIKEMKEEMLLELTGNILPFWMGKMRDDLNGGFAARISGNKKVELIHVKDLLPLTGYIRGGCSPVGMKKQFPTYFQSSITEHEYVYVSAGQRGLQLKINPAELVAFTKGNLF